MTNNRILGTLIGLVVILVAVTTVSKTAVGQSRTAAQDTKRLAREIRHELLTLPWYGVFDWLEGNVTPDGKVTIRGYVLKPTTKSEAEARIKSIEGVEQFNNEIRVLPPSPSDDRLRRAVYASLFNDNSPLFRYALGANPSIHIIIENGKVILKGSVASEADQSIANLKARGVSGVLDVVNDLTVDRS